MKRDQHCVDPFWRRNLDNEEEQESQALIPIEQQTIMFRGLAMNGKDHLRLTNFSDVSD
jgi:hypothetical protein